MVGNIYAQSNGLQFALQIGQCAYQLHTLTVGEGTCCVYHACKLHLIGTEDGICPVQTVPAYRALVFSTGMNRGVAMGANRQHGGVVGKVLLGQGGKDGISHAGGTYGDFAGGVAA